MRKTNRRTMMKGIRAEKIGGYDYYSFCSHHSGYFDVMPQTGWVFWGRFGYYENAQKKGSIFVYQNSSTVQFDKALTQSDITRDLKINNICTTTKWNEETESKYHGIRSLPRIKGTLSSLLTVSAF